MIIKALSSVAIGVFALTMLLSPEKTSEGKSTEAALGNPEELGKVNWLRGLEEGTAESKQSGKPILLLFQEVPGCSNCTRFGNAALSHPLIVEAIEMYFVPVCIFNNKGGKDAAALDKFKEPSWNNPVVRIVRNDHSDIVPRMANFNSNWQIVNGMRNALDRSATAAPAWLENLERELFARESGTETATFSMFCFWSGEGTFGSMDGIVETEPGFQDGKEVVKVVFNPAVVKKSELEAKTKPAGISACAKNEGFKPDDEPKYYLSKSHWRFVPMTPAQASRANSLVGKGTSPEEILSPRQIELGKFIEKNPGKKWKNAIGVRDLAKAWAEVLKIQSGN